MKKSITLIIPAYNEEGAVGKVLSDSEAVLAKSFSNFEIIVVDDGSTDRTKEIVQKTKAMLISNPINMGYGFSLKRGIEKASHEYIITMDADGTYPIDSIVKLAEKLDEGFDMVVGARQGKAYWSSYTKSIFRLIFKWIVEFVLGRRIPDINSGLRAIRKSKILPILPDLSKGFSFSTSSTLIFFLRGYFVAYLPIQYYERNGETKVHHFRDSLKTLQILADVVVSYNPIKLFMLVSLPVILMSALFFLFSLLIRFDYFFFLGVLALLSAFGIISLGFFADIFRKK